MMTHGLTPVSSVHNRRQNLELWWHPLDSYGSGLLADQNGVRFGIVASQSIEPVKSRRRLIMQYIRRVKLNLLPIKVGSGQTLPGNNFIFCIVGEKLQLKLMVDGSIAHESKYIVWSITPPLSIKATGSVEKARLEWSRHDVKTWFGLDLSVVRAGSVELSWSGK
jgi:hypothetical protein